MIQAGEPAAGRPFPLVGPADRDAAREAHEVERPEGEEEKVFPAPPPPPFPRVFPGL